MRMRKKCVRSSSTIKCREGWLHVVDSGSCHTVDFGKMAQSMTQQLKENVGLDAISPVIRKR